MANLKQDVAFWFGAFKQTVLHLLKDAKSLGFAFTLAGCVALSSTSEAVVVFDFNDGTPFDGGGVGATWTLNDPDFGDVTMTTIDVIGQDLTLASEGIDLHTTNIGSSVNTLGINDANNPGGYSNDSRDFNPNEGWIFSFDADVELRELDLASQGGGAEMTVSSSAFSDFILLDGQANDTHDLADVFVPANTPITVQMTSLSTAGDTSLRLAYLEILAGAIAKTEVFSVMSGDVNTGSTWDSGATPDSGSNYNIADGDVVTANSTSFAGNRLVVQSGGTLELAATEVDIETLEVQAGGNLNGTFSSSNFGLGLFIDSPRNTLLLNGEANFAATSSGGDLFVDVDLSGTGDLNFESNGSGSNMFLTAAEGHQGTIRFNGSGDQVLIEGAEGYGTLEMNSTGQNAIVFNPSELLDIGSTIFNQPGALLHNSVLEDRRLWGPGDVVANAEITVDLSSNPVGNERRTFFSSLTGMGDITVNGTASDPTSGSITHNEFEIGSSNEPGTIDVDDYSGTITASDYVDIEVRRSLPNAKFVIGNNSRLEMGFDSFTPGTKLAIGEVEVNSGGTLDIGFEADEVRNVYTLAITSAGDRDGNLTLNAGSTTRMQVNGVAAGEFDAIEVQGDVLLGGTLEILVNPDGDGIINPNYVPTLGDTFDLITIVGDSPDGDYDGNGIVEAADYDLWAEDYGSMIDLVADGNGDGVVDAADYTIWRDNLGATGTAEGLISGSIALSVIDPTALLSGAGLEFQLNVTSTLVQLEVIASGAAVAQAVPEPMTLSLLILPLLAATAQRARRS